MEEEEERFKERRAVWAWVQEQVRLRKAREERGREGEREGGGEGWMEEGAEAVEDEKEEGLRVAMMV